MAHGVHETFKMLGPVRILVAEDDRDLLDAVSAGLGRLGADISRATSGGELIEALAEKGPFDLIITDISMPWMSGLQAMFSARTAGLATPIAVITALKDEKIAEKVLALGARALLLRKPFELGELEAAVKGLLSKDHPATSDLP